MANPIAPKRERIVSLSDTDISDHLVQVSRVAKVQKGGRRFSFAALVVVGDKNGCVGVGLGKAKEVPEAVRKAKEKGQKNSIRVPLTDTGSIPHPVTGRFGATKVIMLPASEGTGVIAGGAVRPILEELGVKNIRTKCIGSRNPHNALKATFDGLLQIRSPEQIAEMRGKKLSDIL